MALLLQGWTVPRSIEEFKSMTKRIFRKPCVDTFFLTRCRQYLKSFMSDGYYSIEALEDCLQESFGHHRKMFDTPLNKCHAKVAITASNIGDASTFIFSNYNGVEDRGAKCGKPDLTLRYRPPNDVPRTYRWLKGIVDGEDEWRSLLNDVDRNRRGSYMRMNISLPSIGAAIDDIGQIETLGKEVFAQFQFQKRNDDREIGMNLLFSRLYFELDESPRFTGHGLYRCRGTIRCKLSGFALAQVAKAMDIEGATFCLDNETLTTTNFRDDVCQICHRFTKKIDFYVRHIDQSVSISICHGTEQEKMRDLSAFA